MHDYALSALIAFLSGFANYIIVKWQINRTHISLAKGKYRFKLVATSMIAFSTLCLYDLVSSILNTHPDGIDFTLMIPVNFFTSLLSAFIGYILLNWQPMNDSTTTHSN